jgi:hypothetical protein
VTLAPPFPARLRLQPKSPPHPPQPRLIKIPANALKSTLLQVLHPNNLKSLRINTYTKPWGGYPIMVNPLPHADARCFGPRGKANPAVCGTAYSSPSRSRRSMNPGCSAAIPSSSTSRSLRSMNPGLRGTANRGCSAAIAHSSPARSRRSMIPGLRGTANRGCSAAIAYSSPSRSRRSMNPGCSSPLLLSLLPYIITSLLLLSPAKISLAISRSPTCPIQLAP